MSELTKEQKFLEIAKYYEELEDKMSEVREQLKSAMTEIGLDNYVQDPDTGIVYKVFKPTGTFVSFKEVDYKRTTIEGERGGGGTVLSKKEAELAGFVVPKK